MKLVHQKTNRRTTIDETVDRAQGIQDAANRLVERVWGRDHYARRAAGWNDLPEQFTATVTGGYSGKRFLEFPFKKISGNPDIYVGPG